MQDYELTLYDRIEVIKATNQKYDLENNAYLSFSGGKDSTVLHYLLDLALPNNTIPRVFIDTGIEYTMIRNFVLKLAENDERIKIIKPSQAIKPMLEKNGYPFKSKEHSLRVYQFNKGMNSNYIKKYISGYDHKGKKSTFVCPKILLYQFEEKGKYNYSNLCCYKLKKEPVKKWQKENNRSIVLTGMRADEGGNRRRLGCVITDKKSGKIVKFHPLIKIDDDFENWFVNKIEKEREIRILCELYYEPFNFKRTGCRGCPYSLDLEEQLEIMERYLPNERKACEIIWKPVYDEYRRLNYRLKQVEQIKLL